MTRREWYIASMAFHLSAWHDILVQGHPASQVDEQAKKSLAAWKIQFPEPAPWWKVWA